MLLLNINDSNLFMFILEKLYHIDIYLKLINSFNHKQNKIKTGIQELSILDTKFSSSKYEFY